MRMPDPVFALLQAFATRYPVPFGLPGEGHENACREWTIKFCQQAAWAFPAQLYGAKRAAPDRPIGKDVLAQNLATGLIGWDVLIGAGTGVPSLIGAPGESLDLSAQVFVPVTPVNWLNGTAPVPDPEPEPDDGHVCEECKLVLERLEVLIEQAFRQTTALTTIAEVAELLRPALRRQGDGTVRVSSQVENRVKIGW